MDLVGVLSQLFHLLCLRSYQYNSPGTRAPATKTLCSYRGVCGPALEYSCDYQLKMRIPYNWDILGDYNKVRPLWG